MMSSMSTSMAADGRAMLFDTGKINQLFDKIGKFHQPSSNFLSPNAAASSLAKSVR